MQRENLMQRNPSGMSLKCQESQAHMSHRPLPTMSLGFTLRDKRLQKGTDLRQTGVEEGRLV